MCLMNLKRATEPASKRSQHAHIYSSSSLLPAETQHISPTHARKRYHPPRPLLCHLRAPKYTHNRAHIHPNGAHTAGIIFLLRIWMEGEKRERVILVPEHRLHPFGITLELRACRSHTNTHHITSIHKYIASNIVRVASSRADTHKHSHIVLARIIWRTFGAYPHQTRAIPARQSKCVCVWVLNTLYTLTLCSDRH